MTNKQSLRVGIKLERKRCINAVNHSFNILTLIVPNVSFFPPFILQRYSFSFEIKKEFLNFTFSIKAVNTPLEQAAVKQMSK